MKRQNLKNVPLDQMIMPNGRSLYFHEGDHKYKDEFDNIYTSVTTLIHDYIDDFEADKIAAACERIGRNPNHPKYKQYKGKSKSQILTEWRLATEEACANGTTKHNFLEDIIKSSSGYKNNKLDSKGYVKLYTIDDILKKHKYGNINLSSKKIKELYSKYPTIYYKLKELVEKGYKIYSEIAVYNSDYLISGLIDILAVKGTSFIILDWKTNKAPIRFEAGYYTKDSRGELTDNYVYTKKVFKQPLSHLADSVGNHYAMQLSLYAYLVSSFGYTCEGIILTHIRSVFKSYSTDIETLGQRITEDEVSYLEIPYLYDDVALMIGHYSNTIQVDYKLF